jgi:phenylalanyl-tRNA synthetase beta chain
MKALYNWIEEKAKSGFGAEALAEKLTMLGPEVEECRAFGGAIPGLVVAEVLTCEKHPDSDHLSVCRVRLPQNNEEVTIICGADNVRAGIKVVVATVGTVLPGDFKIKKAKIRGVESYGMICSREELGLEAKSKGIWILPDNAVPGPAGENILGEKDWAFALAVTSNRADCLSINGLAREAAAAAGKAFAPVQPKVIEDVSISAPDIRIDAPDLCARYAGRILHGVKIGPSPDWLARRVEGCGMRSINNVVDITNYVLLECGHPLHAFDLAKLEGQCIIVRRAGEGEKMTTLDGQERTLDSDTLVIADAAKPVALAGIMGGFATEVSEATVDILLESAWFEPLSVRRSSKRIGLASEASYRFGRGADYGCVSAAMDRAAELIAELTGAKVGPVADVQARVLPQTVISLEYSFIEKHLGTAPPQVEAVSILRNLGFTVDAPGADGKLIITVPSWRGDVAIPADIAEEVARHYGYERMEARLFPVRVNTELLAAGDMTRRILQDELASLGLREAINFNFVLQSDLEALGFAPESCVTVSNPMSVDQRYLRPSLLPNLVGNIRFNLDHGARDAAFFELGKVFLLAGSAPQERLSLAAVFCGRAEAMSWLRPGARDYDFYDAKGVVERIALRLGIRDLRFQKNTTAAGWHPGRFAEIFHGKKRIGCLGEIHPQTAKALDIAQRVIMMEMDVEGYSSLRDADMRVREPSKFPCVLRDLAVVVPEGLECGVVLESIRKYARFLEDVSLVSIWRGEQIGAGNKSLAFSLEFVCHERTLADDEVAEILQTIVRDLEKRHGAHLR